MEHRSVLRRTTLRDHEDGHVSRGTGFWAAIIVLVYGIAVAGLAA